MIMPDPQAQGIPCIVPDVTSCSDHDSDQPPEVTRRASLSAISAPSLSASHGRGDDGMLIHNSPDNCQDCLHIVTKYEGGTGQWSY